MSVRVCVFMCVKEPTCGSDFLCRCWGKYMARGKKRPIGGAMVLLWNGAALCPYPDCSNLLGKISLCILGESVCLCIKRRRVISSMPGNHFLPMLILIGSFSLLAVSTRCRRTSITPSLCLLVSMVSQSACAPGDLVGKTIMQVIWFCWES